MIKISNIISCFSLIMLIGCASETTIDPIEHKENKMEIIHKYQSAKSELENRINTVLSELNLTDITHTRSICTKEPMELMRSLITLPKETLDSLYLVNKPDFVPQRLLYDDEIIIRGLIEISSVKDMTALYTFIDQYVENEGNDFDMVYNALQGHNPTMQDIILRIAVVVDTIFDGEPYKIVDHRAYCINQLQIALVGDLVSSEIVDAIIDTLAAFPGIDVAVLLFTAGWDLHEALHLALEFNKCCVNNWT